MDAPGAAASLMGSISPPSDGQALDGLIQNVSKTSALELVLIVVLRELANRGDSGISETLKMMHKAALSNPDGLVSKEVLAIIENYRQLGGS